MSPSASLIQYTACASIAIWGRNGEKNEAAVAELEAVPGVGKVHAEVCDVAHEDQVEASFARTVEVLGKVDSTFANAGVSVRAVGDRLDLPEVRDEPRRRIRIRHGDETDEPRDDRHQRDRHHAGNATRNAP